MITREHNKHRSVWICELLTQEQSLRFSGCADVGKENPNLNLGNQTERPGIWSKLNGLSSGRVKQVLVTDG